MTSSRAATKRPRPLLAVVTLATALAVSSPSNKMPNNRPSLISTIMNSEPDRAEAENEELHTEEEEIAGDEPETGFLGEEYQPTVDCLLDAGAAPEDYSVTQLESDLRDHFQDSEVDLTSSEFDECLALSDIEFEIEVED